jgi:hypothetical protein
VYTVFASATDDLINRYGFEVDSGVMLARYYIHTKSEKNSISLRIERFMQFCHLFI